MYFHRSRHLGHHLEFLEMLNDDRLSSSKILNGNVLPTRIHQEKNFIPDFQVHRKYAIFVPDYNRVSHEIIRIPPSPSIYLLEVLLNPGHNDVPNKSSQVHSIGVFTSNHKDRHQFKLSPGT